MKNLLKVSCVVVVLLLVVLVCYSLRESRNSATFDGDDFRSGDSEVIPDRNNSHANIDIAGSAQGAGKYNGEDVNMLIANAKQLQDFLDIWAHVEEFAPAEARLTQLNLLMQKWAALMPHEASLKILDLSSGYNRTSLLRTWYSFVPIEDSNEMHVVWQKLFPEERKVMTTAIASNIENNLRYSDADKLLSECQKLGFYEMDKIILSQLGELAAKDKISLNDGLSKLALYANDDSSMKDVFINEWFNESASKYNGFDAAKNIFDEVVSATNTLNDAGSSAVMGASTLLYRENKQEASKLFASIGWDSKVSTLATESITSDLVFADLQSAGTWVAAIPVNSQSSVAGKRILINKLIELKSYDEAYSWADTLPVGQVREGFIAKLKRLSDESTEN